MGDDLRPDIAAARDRLRSKLGSGREIKKLVEHLHDGETVERFIAGRYGRGTGLLTLTDRRILFTLDGMMGQQSEDFPLEKVSSIQWQSGMALGGIIIFASGNKAEIKNVEKVGGKEFVDAVRSRLAAPAAPAVTLTPGQATVDPMEQIRKLAELRDAGILSADEFEAKKTEILARM